MRLKLFQRFAFLDLGRMERVRRLGEHPPDVLGVEDHRIRRPGNTNSPITAAGRPYEPAAAGSVVE